jgi:uncharacterized membrane protein SpoIIM required for sporulation
MGYYRQKRKRKKNINPSVYLSVTIVLGVLTGAVYARLIDSDAVMSAGRLIDEMLSAVREINPSATFVSSFLKHIRIIIILWLVGFTRFPIVLGILYVRFFTLSFTVCAIIKSHYGLAVVITAILPQNIFMLPAITYLALNGLCSITKRISNQEQDMLVRTFALAAGVLCALIAALTDAYVTPVLLQL